MKYKRCCELPNLPEVYRTAFHKKTVAVEEMQIFFKSKLCSFLEQCSHRQESFESLQSVSRGFKHVCLDPPRASYV